MWLLSSVLAALGVVIGGLLVVAGISIVWVKQHAKDKICLIIIGEDRRIRRVLVPKGESDRVTLGSSEDAQTYIFGRRKHFWVYWPAGWPPWMQEPIPAYMYLHNKSEPIDPEETKSLTSGVSLRIMQDEMLLRSLWRDVRETVGLKAGGPAGNIALWISVGSILLVMLALYLIWQVSGDISWVKDTLGG